MLFYLCLIFVVIFALLCFAFSSNHNVHLKVDSSLTAGQRVYISGKLYSTQIRTNDGKPMTSSTVKAFRVYPLNNASGSTSSTGGDQNCVKILGNITTDVTSKDNLTTFGVATHYKGTSHEEGTQSFETSFHRVMAFDTEIRQYIEKTLKKSDRILLTGRLAHMTTTDADGKRLYSGFIVPENIYQLPRRSSSTEFQSNKPAQMNLESN